MSQSATITATEGRVLVVGDGALSRQLLALVLGRLGYAVSCATSASEAWPALAQRSYALALIALRLPEGTGSALTRRIRAAGPQLATMPVLVFGDSTDPAQVAAECQAAGADAYLPKPVSITRLVSMVNHLTRHRPVSPEPPVMRPSPVDVEHLAGFTGGDPQLESELAALYLATAELYLERMSTARDGAAWRAAAHSLKGASVNLGAGAVAALARTAESGEPSPEMLSPLATAVGEVQAFFASRQTLALGR